MFTDMVKKLPELQELIKALGRPIRVATMCSGTESPLLALDKIANATNTEYGQKLGVDHVFSCEIEPFKQAYIERNFAPPILFRDIRELDEDQATTAYGALVDVPGNVDMLVAGTSCVDYSNLNNEKKGLKDAGESGQTFRGMMTWVQKNKPPIIILENVCNAPWQEIAEDFQRNGYQCHFMRLDTKHYYIPHTRTRVYLFAARTTDPKKCRQIPIADTNSSKNKASPQVVEDWKEKVRSLRRPASATLEAFLFDSDDPRVHKGRQMLAMPGEDNTRVASDWARCESRHQRARLEEGLGQRRPFTNWEGGCTMPDYAWNDWGKAQTDRVLDLMDIDFLRLAQADTDSMHKTLVWNLSQNVDRTTGSGAAGICPCLTPSMVPFVTNRGGPLVGVEALSLQGIPVEDLLLTRESEGQMSDLAGNAMTTTVVGACMLSALLLMKDELVKHGDTVKEGLAKEEAKRKSAAGKNLGNKAQQLSAGGAAGAQGAVGKVAGAEDLKEKNLVLCSVIDKTCKSFGDLRKQAIGASRMCVCEAQTGIAREIWKCADCGHTACGVCKGRPEHNYGTKPHSGERIVPAAFTDTLKKALPMRVVLAGLDVSKAVAAAKKLAKAPGAKIMGASDSTEDDSEMETWTAWERAMRSIADAEFMYRDVKRADLWTVRYACPANDEVVLELRLGADGSKGGEWRIIVNPAPHTAKAPHKIYQQVLARMRVAPDAKSALDGEWQILAPVSHEFEVTLTGAGRKVDSWQETLGMSDKKTEVDVVGKTTWCTKRWSEVKVGYGKGVDKGALDHDISGTYKLHENCGAAQASLHKRAGDDFYLFMDPSRNTKGQTDFFVFADNHRRLQYGEHRLHTARLMNQRGGHPETLTPAEVVKNVVRDYDPHWRPNDRNGTEHYKVHTDGRWFNPMPMKLSQVTPGAVVALPKDVQSLGAKSGGCGAAVAIMKARVPLPAANAADWPAGEFETIRNDRSHSTYSKLAWFTSRLELPEGVQTFVPLDNGTKGSCAELCDASCPRCAPQPPRLQWVRQASNKIVEDSNDSDAAKKPKKLKIIARENPQEAAAYEQALKRRPAPFVVQWRKEEVGKGKKESDKETVGDLVIAVNPATLVHRALANITGGISRERSAAPAAKSAPDCEWQVVRHEENDAAEALSAFALTSNRRDPQVAQPPGWSTKYPLRPEQLRSLGWMIRQEQTTVPFVEEEVAESVLPSLGLRMDGRARVERMVRGGIIADQVGYGKTAISIGAVLASQIAWPKKGAAPSDTVRAVPTKATLVLAPSQLLRQWPREVEKFSQKGKLKTIVIRTVADITHLTVKEVQEADVVICATTVLRSPAYFERLARLAGCNRLPDCKSTTSGRQFADSYRKTLGALENQIETLSGEGAAAASAHVRRGPGNLPEEEEIVDIAPKRLKGAALVNVTKAAGGKEGFRHIQAANAAAAAAKPVKKVATPAKKSAASPAAFRKTKPKSTPVKSPKATPKKTAAIEPLSPRSRNTPRRASAAKVVKYAESESDDFANDSEFEGETAVEDSEDDFSAIDSESDEAETKRKKAAKARATKAKKRTKTGDEDDEVEPGDKDHWGFDTAEVQEDWTETTSPALEMFHWRRVIIDEFTYLKPSDRCVVLGLKSEARWCLSGTPPVGAFGEIKDTASLLGTNLGSDEAPRFSKQEITKAETFQFFKEKPTQHWHETRHKVAQGFLDRFVRQNIAEIDEIKWREIPMDIQLRPAERAIYLELDHYLQAMDMKAKKKKRGGNEGDRDKRLAVVLQGSATAEEALIKRCAKFELDDDSGKALRTCQDIINVREKQLEECKKSLDKYVIQARWMMQRLEDMASKKGVPLYDEFYLEEDQPFLRWLDQIETEGVGDAEASVMMREIVAAATDKRAKNAKEEDFETIIMPNKDSIVKIRVVKKAFSTGFASQVAAKHDGEWITVKMVGTAGQHQQKMTCEMTGFEHHFDVDLKKLSNQTDWKMVKRVDPFADEIAAALTKGAKGKKGTPAATPLTTPMASPRKGAGSAAPTPHSVAKATTLTPMEAKKEKSGEALRGARWGIREHVNDPNNSMRKLTEELVGRVRSLRFFRSVRDMQQMVSTDEVPCLVCSAESGAPAKGGKRKGGADVGKPKSESGLLSTCGHIGCLDCLKRYAAHTECGVPGCECPARFSSVISAQSLGTERVTKRAAEKVKSPVKKAKKSAEAEEGITLEELECGVHGTKMAHLVQRIKDTPEDERILVFVQFPDLMKQVGEVLAEANIKALKLKGSVHQQTGALDEFQKEDLKKGDARVLLLLSRDESASGANLTTANHAIFVHPLLTTTQYEYEASETQAIGRIRRYGQTKTVKIWRMIIRDSIDAEIIEQRAAVTAVEK